VVPRIQAIADEITYKIKTGRNAVIRPVIAIAFPEQQDLVGLLSIFSSFSRGLLFKLFEVEAIKLSVMPPL
jgi:hypothetical protein